MRERTPPDAAILDELRSICSRLPGVHEEQAWVGTRWTVRTKNFAHVVVIRDGWPAAYAEACRSDGPITVLTFRSPPEELEALSNVGHPFFKPVWFDDIVGMVIDRATDWQEVAELVTESYCWLAPNKLVEQVRRPGT
ncbi:MAG: MmcQ/YjbR family DNA-binding protein [Ilumatobacteraceae bacterium]